ARESADICLKCHKASGQALWRASAHSQLDKGCNTCHDPHNSDSRQMLREEEPDLCGECHPQQIAEGELPSHHPIAEGKMVCSDCHDVHGGERGNVGRETNAEMCYRCHAEKEGPFTYEHAPVTEDCTICHKPHGSPNDKMLQVEQPMVCLQCHPGHHDSHRSPIVPFDLNDPAQTMAGLNSFYVKCTSCHSLIHGTDLPSGTNNGTFMPGRPAAAASTTEANSGGTTLGFAALSLLGNLMEGVGMEYFGFSEPWAGAESSSGNQTYVREYDGKDYESLQVDSTHSLVREHDVLNIRTQSLGADDQEIDLYYANPRTSVDLNYQEMTHRLGHYDFFADANIADNDSVTHTYLSTEDDLGIDRTTAEARMSYRTPKAPNIRWNLGYWAEREKGRQQFTFLERCGACHKVATTQVIDRTTSELDMGADLALGRSSLSYNHQMRKFENSAGEQFYTFAGVSSVYNGSAPLFGVADTVSVYDELLLRLPVGDSLYLSGMHRSGDRENRYSDINLGIESTGGNATYVLGDDLLLTAGHLSSTLNTEADEGVDRNIRSSRGELRYTGIHNLGLSAGFRREKVERTSHHDYVPQESESDIWTLTADWRPWARLNLRARYRDINTDDKRNSLWTAPDDLDPNDPDYLQNVDEIAATFPARYIGRPNDAEQLQVLVNYLASNKTTLSGLYSDMNDDWAVSEYWSGNNLSFSKKDSREITTAGLSLAHLPTQRSRITAGYYRQEGEVDSDVAYGNGTLPWDIDADPNTPDVIFPPIDSTAKYDYDSDILMLRGDYNLSSDWRLFGSLNQTKTDGKIVAQNLGDYFDQDPDADGIPLTLNPFDITIFDWWFGVGYRLNPTTEVTLSHQFREWENDDTSTQDGDVRIWRLGVRKQF
ncbi:MAG: DmsE family decaheme c-type cytochrome, partial [Armatimonadetes bacterium]|nr:DmsE family decaheme c-type cytochrome [Armatimonadota bacterium]NIM23442.1 DmsE family decaheme c-type cytochrome [Armatimonadota bacterium]NIM67307.1 DmsE family decaheme c-type cytochrome [Armatimonadota bacterium]NIM75805.1 DmsE family decaheme c-type cytochrome [Armatimonadota bacterium]NIN05493.1 DmsE family decaheme c-type cytochrome [Armatimonadota bacterium]